MFDFIHRPNFDFALLKVTWLTPDIKNREFRLPNYNILRTDRPPRKKVSTHGSVLNALTNEVKRKEVPITCPPKTVQSSLRALKKRTKKRCYLAVFYNPPKWSSTYHIPLKDISLMFDFLKSHCAGYFILLGDFNKPETSWETYQ